MQPESESRLSNASVHFVTLCKAVKKSTVEMHCKSHRHCSARYHFNYTRLLFLIMTLIILIKNIVS